VVTTAEEHVGGQRARSALAQPHFLALAEKLKLSSLRGAAARALDSTASFFTVMKRSPPQFFFFALNTAAKVRGDVTRRKFLSPFRQAK